MKTKKIILSVLSVVLCAAMLFTASGIISPVSQNAGTASGGAALLSTGAADAVSSGTGASGNAAVQASGEAAAQASAAKSAAILPAGVGSSEWLDPLKNVDIPTNIDDVGHAFKYLLAEYSDIAINKALGAINGLFPNPGWESSSSYTNSTFSAGHSTFLNKPTANSVWKLGYSSKSIIPDNVLTKNYYFGGFMFPLVPADHVLDDQKVRVTVLDDNTGRGAVVLCVIDGVGIGNGDVRKVRERIMEYAEKNNVKIASINVSCTHAHSCLDTQGLSGKFILSVFTNAIFTQYPFLGGDITSGRDPEFMEGIYSKTAAAVEEAFNGMKAGKLYSKTADISDIVIDKRDPKVFDENINGFYFKPNDGSKATWIANFGAHPTSLSREGTGISGDFPYYMEKYVNETANANFIYFQGAQGAISTNRGQFNTTGEMSGYEVMAAMGTEFGKRLINSGTSLVEIKPILNVRHKEVFVSVENPILGLVISAQLTGNIAVKDGRNMKIATEIGYIEIGENIVAVLLPGEVFPEVVWGGAFSASDAWNKCEFDHPALSSLFEGKKVIAIGLTNDAAGYILPGNDYAPIVADFLGYDHYEELLSGGTGIAGEIADAFVEMVNEK